MLTGFFNNFGSLAIIGSIVALWPQIKEYGSKFISLFIRCDEVTGNRFLDAKFLDHMFKNSKVIRFGNRKYSSSAVEFVKSKKAYLGITIGYTEYILFLYKNYIPVLIKSSFQLKVIYLSWTFSLHKLITEIAQLDLQKTDPLKRHYVVSRAGRNIDTSNSSKETKSIFQPHGMPEDTCLFKFHPLETNHDILDVARDDIGYDNTKTELAFYWQKETLELLKNLEFWLNNKKWFQDRNIPWKRNAIVSGPPGSGKTRGILEVAKKLDCPVIKLDISNMSNEEFQDIFNEQNDNGSIVLIEDIDTVFNGRTNLLANHTNKKSLITFDGLLNTIGGIKSNNGVCTVITTNHPEKLDPALTRSGRCDCHIKNGYLDSNGKIYIANNILKDDSESISVALAATTDMVISDFEELCINLAIQKLNIGFKGDEK